MKFILAKKLHMTQMWKDDKVVPVTVLSAGPCVVTQIKKKETDGYDAVQVGFSFQGVSASGGKKHHTKSVAGHLKKAGPEAEKVRWIREFRDGGSATMKVGDAILIEQFTDGDVVQIVGTSKGKGFAGVVKRHHFAGHPHTHGHKDQERMPGSIGSRRVRGAPIEKGKRMAGHMGTDRVTVKNLRVVRVDLEKRQLFVEGAVPGARSGLVLVTSKA